MSAAFLLGIAQKCGIEKCEIEKRGIQGPRTEKPGDDDAKKAGRAPMGARPARAISE